MVLRGNADAVINYPDARISANTLTIDLNLRRMLRNDKLQRIGNQIIKNLPYGGRMSPDNSERLRNFDLCMALLDFLLDGGNHVTNSIIQVNLDEFELAATQAAILQQIKQQHVHVLRGTLDPAQIVFRFAIDAALDMLPQELGKTAD